MTAATVEPFNVTAAERTSEMDAALNSPIRIVSGHRARKCSRVFLLLFLIMSSLEFIICQEPLATGSPGDFDGYVGQYGDQSKKDGDVVAVNTTLGKLTIETQHNPKMDLEFVDHDLFRVQGGRFEVKFHRDPRNGVDGLNLLNAQDGGKIAAFARFSETPISFSVTERPYTRTEVMIPMRDGVRLHTVIFQPDSKVNLPFLLERTPYGTDRLSSRSVNATKPELAASGYIFVYQDIRGRKPSEGQFIMNRPLASGHRDTDTDESTDAWDTISWLLVNVHGNNQRVGVVGLSYPGFLASMAAIHPHPNVRAICAQAPMTDVWMGDDFFHFGAFRQAFAFDYIPKMESSQDHPFDTGDDSYNFFLQSTTFAGAANAAGISHLPTVKDFLLHPAYDAHWQNMAVERHLTKTKVPILFVTGWFDQEDMWGPQEQYKVLKERASTSPVFLVLGPWDHGGWIATDRNQGIPRYGSGPGEMYRKTVEVPFFEAYLKGKPVFDLADAMSYRTGTNEWMRYSEWPPHEGYEHRQLYLAPNGGLSNKPVPNVVVGSYVSDPENPVPYRPRPIKSISQDGPGWRSWLGEDQAFLKGRRDIARFERTLSGSDFIMTGDIGVYLLASTTGSDGDWVVRLTDMSPDGSEELIASEIFRGRYRLSFTTPKPIRPDKAEAYTWSLHGVDHVFLTGHRIVVSVQSSWFPLYDRNPQTYVSNVMNASPHAYRSATIRILGGSYLAFSSPLATRHGMPVQ